MHYCISALAYEHPDDEPTLHTRHFLVLAVSAQQQIQRRVR